LSMNVTTLGGINTAIHMNNIPNVIVKIWLPNSYLTILARVCSDLNVPATKLS
jgi:hypothetical protein